MARLCCALAARLLSPDLDAALGHDQSDIPKAQAEDVIELNGAADQLLGTLWYEPRPFVTGLRRTLIQHAPDNSFPSDHVTFI